jgi:hypothetical protein
VWDGTTGQLIRTVQGRVDWVQPVALSPDVTRLLTGSGKTLRLWDAMSGQLIRAFDGHTGAVSSVAFSPVGTRVLSGSSDKTIRLWDTATGELIRTFEGHTDTVTSVTFSPDDTRVLSGSRDKTIRLWDTATGERLWTLYTSVVDSVAFSPDGSHLLSGVGRYLTLWNTASGQRIRTWQAHTQFGVLSAAFSPDGTRVLSGSPDRTLKLWHAATGELIRTFVGHTGAVYSVAFARDGARIVSGGGDSTTRVWDAATGNPIATLVRGRDGQWLAITPAGFFAGSRDINGLLGIVRGLRVTTIDQVHQSLFNPDLVREALAGDPEGEVLEATKVINLEKVLDSGPAPSVAIVSPAGGSQSAADLVNVTARIEERGKGVGRIEWRVNGVTAAVGAKPAGGGGAVYTPPHQLALDPGDNTIEVVAYNGSNLLASLPARTTVKFTGPADKAKPKLRILAIGIDRYVDANFAPPLDLAETDAKAFAESMQKAGAGLYSEVPPPTLVLGKDATRANLERTIDRISAEIQPRDTFILFASGHGASWKGRFYLIPQDHRGGWANMSERAIGQDQLQDWLANRIKAKRVLILLDTCESGALIAGHARSRTEAPATEAAVGRLHEATGRPVLTGAAVGQSAHEGEIGASGETQGYFTWAVLDALRNGDTNGNGLIELSELVAHVQTVVPRIAARGGGGQVVASEPAGEKQAARFGSRGEDFVVARRLP